MLFAMYIMLFAMYIHRFTVYFPILPYAFWIICM